MSIGHQQLQLVSLVIWAVQVAMLTGVPNAIAAGLTMQAAVRYAMQVIGLIFILGRTVKPAQLGVRTVMTVDVLLVWMVTPSITVIMPVTNVKQEHTTTDTITGVFYVALAVVRIEINPLWILCDNESTVNIFKNKEMITNIRKSENPIRLRG